MPRRKRGMKGGKITASQVVGVLKKAHDYIKKHKVISRTANALGSVGLPYGSTIGSIAATAGYGRRRRVGRPRKRRM